MSFILNIETATKNCSVSIAKNGDTILCKEIAEEGYSHAEKLHVFIEDIVKEAAISMHDLVAIAVSQGPGSYTGLRIGVSAAKGLCFALNIPLIAVDTLQTLASKANISEGKIIPMLDARRMEVYNAIFNSNLEKERAVQAEIITENSFSDFEETLYFVGDCAEKCKPFLVKDNFIFLEEFKYPSAREMSKISYEKYKISDTVDVAYFEPYYLKDFMMTTSSKK
ncbi:tRNA (adenosine(37)-N6)-threonylcarbamoyltransferase complex dimerization subunit type 1 TsaB [Flavobacterium sp. Fl-77]|uniref:tRNA (Adenosine(37)-N6)-threonylcarbamoyltransferase complex dimerization subunit type 1 TsaB n=1 Tax=Flavobacterium flavipigmentatum TaxID=2893884 RepID=A0AAJ2W275_9FLAO|nr:MULTISPECIES: tRNA (adenosine(37)-N6)-threonylcarbamoyltransferase complex dimerization subunit type 1 TsaB [unclassified Flavobacterium]MDX6183553.1 tRNA (adenosine(37)-N6)-threonylcarbamoyltransferase complex dimerization subunit type 1 TsaB [Flavobacterium sp. Fl-33]MDX6187045.1 tRNA (adenosine(37)-N6)-threonylcarbamoyltransferase complex dimerization subunit type 1 TsaB [Flavobacterium sp. Fl-77]UFH40223.1 tRNA (adenosine(37)-N6)-threonylcarbamoyltransferase complex dimerization subunit t